MADEKKTTENEIVTIDYGAQLRKLDQKLERLVDLYSDGSIDKSVLDKQVAKLNNEKRDISEQHSAQTERTARSIAWEQLQDYAIVLESAAFADRQAIIQKLIRRLTIYKDRLEIEWNF